MDVILYVDTVNYAQHCGACTILYLSLRAGNDTVCVCRREMETCGTCFNLMQPLCIYMHLLGLLMCVSVCFVSSVAIAIKESVHVGDKTQKRLARGVDDLGMSHTPYTFYCMYIHVLNTLC